MTIPPAMPWVKLHTSYLEDSRFARLGDPQKARFFELLMLAGKLDAGGYFIEHGRDLTEAEIAWKLRLQAEQLCQDLEALASVDLACKNGHGWCLPDFESEQGPAQADKRAAWKERQKKHRNHDIVTRDSSVTNPLLTPLESESESESESDKEKEEESSSSDHEDSPATKTMTACLAIFKALGASPVQIKYLKKTPGIQPADIWAMAAMVWNNPKVRKQGFITLQNILSGERASADWYQESAWSCIPAAIRQSGGIDLQGQEKTENHLVIVATRNSEETEAARIWQLVKDQIGGYKANGNLKTFVGEAYPVDYAINLLHVAVPNIAAMKWLEERASKTINRLLVGITNNPAATVQFILREETP